MIVYVSKPFGVPHDASPSLSILFKTRLTKFLSKSQNLLSVVKDRITRYSLWYFNKP